MRPALISLMLWATTLSQYCSVKGTTSRGTPAASHTCTRHRGHLASGIAPWQLLQSDQGGKFLTACTAGLNAHLGTCTATLQLIAGALWCGSHVGLQTELCNFVRGDSSKMHAPAYLLAVLEVLFPGALRPEVLKVVLEPDLEVEGCDIVAGCLEQMQCQAAVYSAAEQHSHLQGSSVRLTPAQVVY